MPLGYFSTSLGRQFFSKGNSLLRRPTRLCSRLHRGFRCQWCTGQGVTRIRRWGANKLRIKMLKSSLIAPFLIIRVTLSALLLRTGHGRRQNRGHFPSRCTRCGAGRLGWSFRNGLLRGRRDSGRSNRGLLDWLLCRVLGPVGMAFGYLSLL